MIEYVQRAPQGLDQLQECSSDGAQCREYPKMRQPLVRQPGAWWLRKKSGVQDQICKMGGSVLLILQKKKKKERLKSSSYVNQLLQQPNPTEG